MRGPLVQSPFDEYSSHYDAEFTETPLGKVLRRLVWSQLDSSFQPGDVVLELGCGTGEDAVELARRGIRVVATDPSPGMIEVARRKAAACSVVSNVEFHVLGMDEAVRVFVGRQFDGLFSNFGAVNCAFDLAALTHGAARLLKPHSRLIWVVMGKYVPWEWIWFLLKGNPKKAFRRFAAGGVAWRGLNVRYPAPWELARILGTHFEIHRIAPLGCVLPPSYAAARLNRSPRLLAALGRLERAALNIPPFAAIADHFLIEARIRKR